MDFGFDFSDILNTSLVVVLAAVQYASQSVATAGFDMVSHDLSFMEAAFGTTREVRSPVKNTTCHGSGARAGTVPETCPVNTVRDGANNSSFCLE